MKWSSLLKATVAGLVAMPTNAQTTWDVIVTDSRLSFTLQIGGSDTTGHFETWSADINYDPEILESARVSVTIDISSAQIDNDQAGPLLTSATWLGAQAYPASFFTGEGMKTDHDGRLSMTGELALKGTTLPVTLLGTIDIDDDTALAVFQTDLPRAAFSIGDTNPAVSAVVQVTAQITAERAPE